MGSHLETLCIEFSFGRASNDAFRKGWKDCNEERQPAVRLGSVCECMVLEYSASNMMRQDQQPWQERFLLLIVPPTTNDGVRSK